MSPGTSVLLKGFWDMVKDDAVEKYLIEWCFDVRAFALVLDGMSLQDRRFSIADVRGNDTSEGAMTD